MISIIIPCRNDALYLEPTLDLIEYSIEELDYEVIVVDDGSLPPLSKSDLLRNFPQVTRVIETLGVGPAQARNLGAKAAKGEILVFFDCHVAPLPGWDSRLSELLMKSDIGIVGPVISDLLNPEAKGFGGTFDLTFHFKWLPKRREDPYPVPALSGCAMAMRRETFFEIGEFDRGLRSWGDEDVELCLRSWLMGYTVYLYPSVEVMHLFRPRHPYQVSYFGIVANKIRIALLHWLGPRLARSLKLLSYNRRFLPALLFNLMDDELWERREFLLKRRRRDDEWFCKRFEIRGISEAER